ncbi:MAG: NusG domain II-containing protein [Erysipelotrichaceae bacterium]
MNKADKVFIVLVLIGSFLFYIPLIVMDHLNEGKTKQAVVSYKDSEILRIDMLKNDVYKVKGSLGPVSIEVKDKAVRVEKENSPYHLCSIQGWVKESNRPIICLPNDIVVQIESVDKDNNSDVDTVIQ